jgi:hypothetical protein
MAKKRPKVKDSDVVEVIAESIFGDGGPARAIKIVLENVADVDEIQLIAEDMLQSPWETLQEEGSMGEVNRVLAQVSDTLMKLKLKPIVECFDADENSVEVHLPYSVRHRLNMKQIYNYENLSGVVSLVKKIEENSKYLD